VQWDKDDLDTLGLIKVDVLALGMLSAMRRSLAVHRPQAGPTVRDAGHPRRRPAHLRHDLQADTIGVFQIESRAQMSMLPRLKPRVYYDLVVQVAIVRPGPIQGGMVHPYLRNRSLPDDEIAYPPALKPALQRTKGVPIFQEQVMQIAILAPTSPPARPTACVARWRPGSARAGSGPSTTGWSAAWSRRATTATTPRASSSRSRASASTASESHAAGFALLAYDSSWIKHHHPDAFLAGLLNSQPMGFYAPAQLVRDAREHGVAVRPVDVGVSDWECTLEGEGRGDVLRAVRLGLNRVAGLSEDAARRIADARAALPFVDVEDLARRATLNAHELRVLAEADALAPLAGNRHQAAWAVAGIDTRPTEMLRATRVAEPAVALGSPSEVENTLADYRALGLTLGRHPVALLREKLDRFKVQPAAVLRHYPHGRLARASGLVTHRQRPETAKGTVFVTLEDETGQVNVIVWPAVVESQRRPLLGATLLTVYGQWQREGDVMHLVAMKMVDHTGLLQGLQSRSRDFR
jgi:error-prone DNA polymerase